MIKETKFNYKKYYSNKNLLSINQDSKTVKGTKKGYLTGILYLAPHKTTSINTCPKASKGCSDACIYIQGRGKFSTVQQARIRKTNYFKDDRNNFMLDLYKSITKLIKKANNLNLIPVVRLNGTSDLRWENIRFNYNGKHKTIFQAFPTVQFYDYTKFELKTKRWDNLPSNYDLTFSLSEENSLAAYELLLSGQRVAMVYRDKLPGKQIFKTKDLITEFNVINADETDLRFKDGKGVICGLIAKGTGKQDATGFVKDNNIINI
tara:strand:+ start:617 stop:1405 length:789 start_codon:yes stop_codon:yes gene_type:complete